jgi:hypothetical protein
MKRLAVTLRQKSETMAATATLVVLFTARWLPTTETPNSAPHLPLCLETPHTAPANSSQEPSLIASAQLRRRHSRARAPHHRRQCQCLHLLLKSISTTIIQSWLNRKLHHLPLAHRQLLHSHSPGRPLHSLRQHWAICVVASFADAVRATWSRLGHQIIVSSAPRRVATRSTRIRLLGSESPEDHRCTRDRLLVLSLLAQQLLRLFFLILLSIFNHPAEAAF